MFFAWSQVQSRPVFAKPDEPQKPVWSGWLSCIGGNAEYLRSLPEDFTCLPLFCSHGPEGLTSAIKSWFQRNFDCSFGPLELSHVSLQWLMALWTNCHAESGIQHLKMIWSVPVAPPLQVTYMVDPQDAWALWDSLRNSQRHSKNALGELEEDNIDVEEVMMFIQELKSHFYRHFRVDLSAGSLNQVSTALGSAKCNGRIKVPPGRSASFEQQHLPLSWCCCLPSDLTSDQKILASFLKMSLKRILALHFQQLDYWFSLFFPPDFQQQIHDHHPDAADGVCSPQDARLRTPPRTVSSGILEHLYTAFFFFSFLGNFFFWFSIWKRLSRPSPPSFFFFSSDLGENLSWLQRTVFQHALSGSSLTCKYCNILWNYISLIKFK